MLRDSPVLREDLIHRGRLPRLRDRPAMPVYRHGGRYGYNDRTRIQQMKTFSKHNIFGKIRDSENYFIINPLSGNADILTPEKAREIREKSYTDVEEYSAKGYLVDENEEDRRYRLRYLDFLDERESNEVQLFFVPWYACNFSCSYCYQEGYAKEKAPLTEEVINAFYNYITREFSDKKKYITIFGGEPLLAGAGARASIEQIITKAEERGIPVAVVTNGYHLADYLDVLAKGTIREIQVTLDGVRGVHDARRPLKGGGGTFDRVVEGIDGALVRGFPVNLRMVIDRDNMEDLPALAEFAMEKGWTRNPLFKTQIGRNYELHRCQADSARLFERAGLYEKLYEIIQRNPRILEFHRPAYSLSRFLFDTGELPVPLYDSCPGCKSEWAFDYTGRIYPCTATVGKDGEEVGTFYPEETKREEVIEEWESRDVIAIPECAGCSLQLACGGGCASVAKNRTGKLHAPDCRPVRPLLEMGISLYFNKGNV